MNEKDLHLKLNSLDIKRVSTSNEKFIINSVLSYKPDDKVLQWMEKKILNVNGIKNRQPPIINNRNLKEKKKSSFLKKNIPINRNASNKTKLRANVPKRKTTQLITTDRRGDGLLNKSKNTMSYKKSMNDQKNKMPVEYNEIKKHTKIIPFKKTVVERTNPTKITSSKKRNKMKGKEQAPSIIKMGNQKKNNDKNMQGIKENKNVISSKNDKNLVHNKKKNVEKKDITIRYSLKNKIPNDEMKKLSNIPKLQITNIKNNSNGSVTNERIEKTSPNSSSTHFVNSDETVKKCYHTNNHNNSDDRIMIHRSFYKNNIVLSIPVPDNREIQETYEEISKVLDSDEEKEEEVPLYNDETNNKEISEQRSVIKEVEEIDNKKLEEYSIMHNKGSKSVNSIKEPNFFNSLIFTNEFRLKMCYSNNFIDLKKIYFEKSLEEGNNTSQGKEDSSFFKNNDSLNSSELFSISLDTEKTKMNETEIKRKNVESKQLLEEPPPSHHPIQIVENLNISEPLFHSYLLKGFNDSFTKDKLASNQNLASKKKENRLNSKKNEHCLMTDEIEILQDKEMEVLSKLIQENGIYNESLTQNSSSPECTEGSNTVEDSNANLIIQNEFQNENKFSSDILLVDSVKKKELMSILKIQEEEEESPIIDDFKRIDQAYINKHFKDNEIKINTQQQVEGNENKTKKEIATSKHIHIKAMKDITTPENKKEAMNISQLVEFHKYQQEIRRLDLSSILNDEQNKIMQKRNGPLSEDTKKRSRSLMIPGKDIHHASVQQVMTKWGKRGEDEDEDEHEDDNGTWDETEVEEILKKEIVNSKCKLKLDQKKKKKQRKKKMNALSPKSVQEKSHVSANKNLVVEKHKKEYKEKGFIIKTEGKAALLTIKNEIRGYHKRNSLLRRKILKNKMGTKVIIKNHQEKKENNEEENRIVQRNLTNECELYNEIGKGKKHSLNVKLNKYKKKKKNRKRNSAEIIPKKIRKEKNEIAKSKIKRNKNKILKNINTITNINKSIHNINYDTCFFYGNPNVVYRNCESLEYMIKMMKHNIEFVMNIHKKTEINKMNSNNSIDTNKTMEKNIDKLPQFNMNYQMINMEKLNVQRPIDTISNKLHNTNEVPCKKEYTTTYKKKHKKEIKKEEENYDKNGKEMDPTILPFHQNNNNNNNSSSNSRSKVISELIKKNKREYLFREETTPVIWNNECFEKKADNELHKESYEESFQKNRKIKGVSKTNEFKLWSSHLSDTSTCDEEFINRGSSKVEAKKRVKDNILVDSEKCVNTIWNNESVENGNIKREQEVSSLKYKEEVKDHKEREKNVFTEVSRNNTIHNYSKKKEEEFHVLNKSWLETRENLSEQFALDLAKYVRNHRIVELNINKKLHQEINDKKNQTIIMNIDSRDNALLRTASMKNSQRASNKIYKEKKGNYEIYKNGNEWMNQLNDNTVVRKAKLKKVQAVVEEKKKNIHRKAPSSIQNFFKQILNETYSYPMNKSKKYLENPNSVVEHKNNVGRNGYMISAKNANTSKLGFSKSLMPMKTSLHNKNSMAGISDILSKVQNNKKSDISKKEIFLMYEDHFNQLSSIINTTKVYKKQKEPQPRLKRNKSMFVGKSFECLRKRNEEDSKKREIKNYNPDKIQNFNKTDMFCVKKDPINFFEKIKKFKLFQF